MNLTFVPETNWVDIVVVIFLIRGCYVGYSQGFSVELFKTIGSIAAAVVSLLYYDKVGEWLAAHSFLSLQTANVISFLIFLFLLLLVFKLVRTLMFKILHFELIGSNLERWCGFFLGLFRGVVFVSLFLFLLVLVPVPYFKESVEVKSFSGPCLKQVAPRIVKFVTMFKPKKEGAK